MAGLPEVRAGVTVGRGVAAADVPAAQADPQVHPAGCPSRRHSSQPAALGTTAPGVADVRAGARVEPRLDHRSVSTTVRPRNASWCLARLARRAQRGSIAIDLVGRHLVVGAAARRSGARRPRSPPDHPRADGGDLGGVDRVAAADDHLDSALRPRATPAIRAAISGVSSGTITMRARSTPPRSASGCASRRRAAPAGRAPGASAAPSGLERRDHQRHVAALQRRGQRAGRPAVARTRSRGRRGPRRGPRPPRARCPRGRLGRCWRTFRRSRCGCRARTATASPPSAARWRR